MHGIEIGGKFYEVKYTINALAEIEEMSGHDIEYHLSRIQRSSSVASLRWLFGCGCRGADATIGVNGYAELLETYLRAGGSLKALFEQITAAAEECGFFTAALRMAEEAKAMQAQEQAEALESA